MTRKKTRSQEPTGHRNSLAKKNTARKAGLLRKKSEATTAMRSLSALSISRAGVSARSRMFVVLALLIPLIAIAAIRAQQEKPIGVAQNHPERVSNATLTPQTTTNAPKSGEMSPESLTSPSLYSKEYIHSPGGRIIATQELVVFTDVDPGSDFYDDIYRIAARGVTLGCTTTTYCPNNIVIRDQMAVFIERALGVFSAPTPTMQHFTDVPPGYWAYAFIEDFATRNITNGCTPTTYCPASAVSHEQMAKFIIRARGEPDPPWPTQQRFNDVPISGPNANPFANFIDRMAFLGIWQGCGSNNYCPANPVTRRQMAHILVRAFGI